MVLQEKRLDDTEEKPWPGRERAGHGVRQVQLRRGRFGVSGRKLWTDGSTAFGGDRLYFWIQIRGRGRGGLANSVVVTAS